MNALPPISRSESPKESPKNPTPEKTLRGLPLFLAALFLVLTFGSAFTLVGLGVEHMSPEWLVAGRMSIGAVLVALFCKIRGLSFPPLKDIRWLWYICIAASGASLPFMFIAMAQLHIDSGLSAILVGAMPLITIILAHFFTQEKLNRWKLLGFIIGFSGIVLLFLPQDLSPALVAHWPSQLLALGAAALFAITTILASRAPPTPAPVAAAMMLGIGAFMSILWAYFVVGRPPSPPLAGLCAMIGLGIGSTAIATIVFLHVIDEAGPSVMARINYCVPVASVLFGIGFMGEHLDWRIIIALGVIIFGIILSNFKSKQ